MQKRTEPTISATRWQLFIDDYACARTTGFDRVVHHPKPHGVVIPADKPWETVGIQPIYVGRRSDGTFEAYLSSMWWDIDRAQELDPCWRDDKAHNIYRGVGYARSDDGIHWEKPSISVCDAPTGIDREKYAPFASPTGSSRDNNLGVPIAMVVDLGSSGGVSNPDQRFALRFAPPGVVGVGMSWEHAPTGYFAEELPDVLRVLRDGDESWIEALTDSGGTFDPRHHAVHYWDDLNAEWATLTQGIHGHWIPSRDVARWGSTDLKSWHGTSVLYPDAADSHEAHHYEEPMGMHPFRDTDAGGDGTVFGMLSWFHSDRSHPDAGPRWEPTPEHPAMWPWCRKGTNEMRITVSHDGGYTWDRAASREAWIPHGTEHDSYDRLAIGSLPPVRVGDEDWFYSLVIDGDHLGIRNDTDQTAYYRTRLPRHQIALYTQKRHRYVSLRTRSQKELLITKPFRIEGDTVELNVDAGHGQVRVGIADAGPVSMHDDTAQVTSAHMYENRPIEGFSFDDCESVVENSITHRVRYNSGHDVGELKGRTVRLVIETYDADLYGFRVTRV
jgi:hypothetical protein